MTPADTIFALSSGHLPAAIAVVRISGPQARSALDALTEVRPEPRRATVADLRYGGDLLDRALLLWFPGPSTVTGEDLLELHLHGGRAVVAAVMRALGKLDGLRPAEPGEFTRRAFANGRIDLTEAEGLADLLEAETEAQRRRALELAGGAMRRRVAEWTHRLLALAAAVEARLDFPDEGDVEEGLPAEWHEERAALAEEIGRLLDQPPAERLRDGIRVVIAGPTNSGKSTLLNALVGREAAITSVVAGTTRDLIEAPVAIAGIPFLLVDSAGLRSATDAVEVIGIGRAMDAVETADIVLWLGDPEERPERQAVLTVQSKSDLGSVSASADLHVSGLTGEGLEALVARLLHMAEKLLPSESELSSNARQREALTDVRGHLRATEDEQDLLIVAEELRQARVGLDRVTGRGGVEDMLDSLFGRFCIGK